MDYAEQVKTVNQVDSFTYFEYLKLKRKPRGFGWIMRHM